MRVALGQMEVVWGDWEGNVSRARALVREASRNRADWILLPEMWACGFSLGSVKRWVERTRELLNEMTGWCRGQRIGIVGSLPERSSEGFHNTAYVLSPDGALEGGYRKIHLFPPMDEDRYLKPGGSPFVFQTAGGAVGLMICYDLRFPELARSLAFRGARALWVPAHWPHPRLEHWRVMARARAMENQLFVLAANACGRNGELHFFGHSMAVDPWGEIIAEGGEGPELICVELDPERVEEARESLPVLRNHRSDLYGSGLGGDKVMDESGALSLVLETRRNGRTVVFTNGCFDLLHAGHVQYLKEAKAMGDLLVVGINTDESVREIKGENRPINPLEDRLQVLAGLSCVDLLVPFADRDPHHLIEVLQPDVLVKGSDWAEQDIVGHDLVKARGGKVVRLPIKEGVSTTDIIHRILRSERPSEGAG